MDLFKLVGNLIINGAKKAQEDIEDTGKSAEKASETFSKFGVSFEKLNTRISGQHKKLDLLKQKYADLYLTQGKTADETQEVAAEIEKLSAELSRNEKAFDEAKSAANSYDKTLENVGGESQTTGEISSKSLSPIPSKFAKIATAATAVITAIVAMGKKMIELADNTRAYRIEMGKLETAFDSAGHSAEEATATYNELYSVLGETDRAVEASQHIALLCESEEQMKAMTDACIGVFAKWDDSIPLESLAEAANETAKTGKITGAYADALNWAGASEEEFQKKLDACNSERERAALVVETLVAIYGEAAAAYKENNKEVIAATSAQDKLTAATARWGEVVEPIVTAFREGLAGAINFAADAFEYMADPVGKASKALAGTAESSEEAAKRVESLQAELQKFEDNPSLLLVPELQQHYQTLTLALEEAEAQYNELAGAEQNAADGTVEAVESTAEATAEYASLTEQYVADAQALIEKFAATYESMYSKVANFFKPFETAKVSVTTNINDMMAAMQSQVDFNTSYSSSLQSLAEYGLGGLAEAFRSYGAEGAAYAQAIVDAVEQAGGATTAEGQAIIQGFDDINQQVAASEEELALTMTEMGGEFDAALQNMKDAYAASIDGLNKSAEAKSAAIETFGSFIQGMVDKLPELEAQVSSFGSKITAALQSGIGSVSIPITFNGITASAVNGSHASGLDYVPYDGYIAELHKGEMVVPADEAKMLRNGSQGAGENSVTADLLALILDTLQDIRNQETVMTLNNREFGRAVRRVVNA